MATYNSDDIAAGNPPVDPGFASLGYYRTFRFTLSNTSLTTGDKIDLVQLNGSAGGSVLLSYFLEIPVIDTGTTMAWNLGDSANTTASTAFISGTTAGRTATGPAAAEPLGIVFNTATTAAPAFLAGTVRQAVPRTYTAITAGNSTTGGVSPVYLLMTMVTGAGTAVSTGIKITGWVALQDYGVTPLVLTDGPVQRRIWRIGSGVAPRGARTRLRSCPRLRWGRATTTFRRISRIQLSWPSMSWEWRAGWGHRRR